jgi:hypothetical protein
MRDRLLGERQGKVQASRSFRLKGEGQGMRPKPGAGSPPQRWTAIELAVFEQEADQPSELLGVFWGGIKLVLELNKIASSLLLSA